MKAIWMDFSLPRMAWTRIAGRLNRHAYWGKLAPLTFGERPEPDLPGEDWVKVRTLYGGICGSDISTVTLAQRPDTILRPHVSYPMLLGHENLARVVEVGPAVDDVWVGKRVCVEPTLCCRPRGIEPVCDACADGILGACRNFSQPGNGLPAGVAIGYNHRTGGSWGETFVAHRSQLFEVDESIDDETGILVDPLACALHGVMRAIPADDEQVLVVGAGIVGLGVVTTLRALGCKARIIVDARHEFQIDAAVHLGANQAISAGRPGSAERYEALAELCGARVARGMFGTRVLSGGFDVIFDCVGSGKSIQDSLRTVRGGGKIVMLGTNNATGVDWTPVWFRELQILGVNGRRIEDWNGQKANSYAIILELLAEGKLKTEGLLTHTFPLTDFRAALAAVTAKRASGAIKVALKHDAE